MAGDAPRVTHHPTARAYLDAALPLFASDEVEHGLLYTIALRFAAMKRQPPLTLVTVSEGDGVVAAALRTPPHKLLLTRADSSVSDALAADLARSDPTLPGLLAETETARAFAESFARRAGCTWRFGTRQRIHRVARLDDVRAPSPPAPGMLRVARRADLARLVPWVEAFEAEAGVTTIEDAARFAEALVAEDALFVWDRDGVVSMAALGSATPTVERVRLVYTPPALRGCGYASSCVAALTRRVLEAGRTAALYTDLGNPTSNAIYARIGYAPVVDVTDVHFVR